MYVITNFKKIQHYAYERLSTSRTTLKSKPKSTFIVAFVLLFIPISIFAPFYQSGFILQYDMLFSPYVHINWESIQQGTALHHGLAVTLALKLLGFVLPMDIVQKIILSAIFFLSALSIYRSVPVQSKAARLLAGLMYSVNPFTYDRLMAGHWIFLLAYSITPFALKAFYNFYVNPSRRNILYAIIWWTVIVAISAHHLLLLGLLFATLGVMFIRSWQTLFRTLLIPIGVLVLNMWWIIPISSSNNFTLSFGLEQLYAFATRIDPVHGLWVNMLSLQGFWYAGWQSTKDLIPFWPLVFLVWLTPVFIGLAGLRVYVHNHRKLLAGLLIIGIITLLLAAGPNPSVWQANAWLHTYIPGMSGMRESQKFLALLALVYAVLAAFGVDLLLRLRNYMAWVGVSIVAIAVVLMALPIFWGAHGQMKLSHYPDSWQHLHDTLYKQGADEKVVVLPWSIYTSDTFVPTLVGNPARVYFGDKAIVSQKMNLPGVLDQPSSVYSDIEKAIVAKNAELLINAMRREKARYLLIADPARRQAYEWLLQQPNMTVDVSTKKSIIIKLTKH